MALLSWLGHQKVERLEVGKVRSACRHLLLNKTSLSNRESESCRRICAVRSLKCEFGVKRERSLFSGRQGTNCQNPWETTKKAEGFIPRLLC
jgi:hypothetical protein